MRPLHLFAALVVDRRAGAGEHRPVAVLEIGDPVGEGRERDGVGAEIHLAVAVADGERAAAPRADHEVVLALEEDGERERALEPLERRLDRLLRREPLGHVAGHQVGDHLGVGLGRENRAVVLELGLELAEILDDAVVDERQPLGRVRMGVHLGRRAVGRPARMADAGVAGERRAAELLLEVPELALGPAALEMARLRGWRFRPNRSRGTPVASGYRRDSGATGVWPRIPTIPHMRQRLPNPIAASSTEMRGRAEITYYSAMSRFPSSDVMN